MERLAVGTEIEFGLNLTSPERRKIPEDEYSFIVNELLDCATHNPLLPAVRAKDNSVWIGSHKLYRDPRGHLEIAVCEAERLDDTVVWEEAAKKLVKAVAVFTILSQKEKAGKTSKGEKISFFLSANNTDYAVSGKLNVWGYHENYSGVGPPIERTAILPFLVTRQIFAGAGAIMSENAEKPLRGKFLISPRAITLNFGGGGAPGSVVLTVSSYTPVFQDDKDNERRTHIVIGETNISQCQTKLKIGTTKLVHQLFMAGWQPPSDILRLSPSEWAEVGRTISKLANYDDFGKWTVSLNNGKEINAIEIQRIYLKAAEDYFGSHNDPDINWTLEMWEKALDVLEDDPTKLTIADWVLKLNLYERLKRKGVSQKELVKIDMLYHALEPTDEENIFLLAGGEYLYSGEEIQKALQNTPKTRAQGRFLALKAVKYWLSERQGTQPQITIDWNKIEIQNFLSLEMPSPTDTYSSAALEFEAKLFPPNQSPEGKRASSKESKL